MQPLILCFFTFILGVVVTTILFRGTEKKVFVPAVPRSALKDAQHAADASQHDQVVIFDGETFRVARAQNQYSYEGVVVHVAHPEAI